MKVMHEQELQETTISGETSGIRSFTHILSKNKSGFGYRWIRVHQDGAVEVMGGIPGDKKPLRKGPSLCPRLESNQHVHKDTRP